MAKSRAIPAQISEQSIGMTVDGYAVTISRDNPSYLPVRQALKNGDWDRVRDLIDVRRAIANYTKGRVTVTETGVFYGGEEVKGVVADKILEAARDGLPFEGFVKFLENLMSNPSRRAREELFGFLNTNGLHIDPDTGYFWGYKAVRSNYMDCHSGTVSNHIGANPKMPRKDVDDDASRGCSHGYHVGALSYVDSFCPHDGIKLIVSVNPRDVVSIPHEDHRKLRCCEYSVVDHFKGQLTDLLVDRNMVPVKPMSDAEYEDDEDFFDWEDWDDEDVDMFDSEEDDE